MNLFKRIINRLKWELKTRIFKDPFYVASKKWIKDAGDKTLRLTYPLDNKSIVLDIGGYDGEWSQAIHSKYGSQIHIFEPVSDFYYKIELKFKDNGAIYTYPYGLSDQNKKLKISLQDNGSSTIRHDSSITESVELKDIFNFCKEHNISEIDLIKINIEGGEYDLLERMFDTNMISKCKNIQVQFHDFFPEAKELRKSLRSRLSKTHKLTYDYYFIWENWEIK